MLVNYALNNMKGLHLLKSYFVVLQLDTPSMPMKYRWFTWQLILQYFGFW